MDAPYYSVTVAQGFADDSPGWSYTVVHGEKPDETEPVLLADQLSYAFSFRDGVVPGQLAPAKASYGFYCQTSADIPVMELGDLVHVVVRVSLAGPVIIDKGLKVTEIEADLDPDSDETHPVYVSVTLTDPVADTVTETVVVPLGAVAGTWDGHAFSARYQARSWWRCRLAEIGALVNRSIGAPDSWNAGYDGEQPDPGLQDGVTPTDLSYGLAYVDPANNSWAGKSGFELLTQLLNSHQPAGVTHAILTRVTGAVGTYPSSYDYVEDERQPEWPAIPDPDSAVQLLVVPASRESGAHGVLELEATWCEVPAKVRRGREHVVNVVNVGGLADVSPPGEVSGAITIYRHKPTDAVMGAQNTPDRLAYGIQARDLPTQLRLYRFPQEPFTYTPLAPADVAAKFLTDTSARDQPWAYDSFQLVASYMDQADAETVLPAIAPRTPGEPDGDGHALRHVRVSHLDPSIDFPHADVDEWQGQVRGFLTAGRLDIVDGDLLFNLTLTPGEPT